MWLCFSTITKWNCLLQICNTRNLFSESTQTMISFISIVQVELNEESFIKKIHWQYKSTINAHSNLLIILFRLLRWNEDEVSLCESGITANASILKLLDRAILSMSTNLLLVEIVWKFIKNLPGPIRINWINAFVFKGMIDCCTHINCWRCHTSTQAIQEDACA